MNILLAFKNDILVKHEAICAYMRNGDRLLYKVPRDDKCHWLDLEEYDCYYIYPALSNIPIAAYYRADRTKAAKNDTDISFLFDKILEINKKNGIPQSVYVTEECSELIKAFTKDMRKKGSKDDIIEEACDVLTTVFVLLKDLGVSREQVRSNIIMKCRRQIDRYYDHGEL